MFLFQLEINRLDFDFGDKSRGQNRLDNKVSGKGKKGGQGIDERSVLCYIECKDKNGDTVRYPVRQDLNYNYSGDPNTRHQNPDSSEYRTF